MAFFSDVVPEHADRAAVEADEDKTDQPHEPPARPETRLARSLLDALVFFPMHPAPRFPCAKLQNHPAEVNQKRCRRRYVSERILLDNGGCVC